MSKLEHLIAELCPEGVEYKKLWEVTIWDKNFQEVEKHKQPKTIKYNYLLANKIKKLIVQNGDVKLLTTNKSNLYTKEELVSDILSEGEIVCIPWGGNPIVQYYNGKFVTSDNRIATSFDTNVLSNKYLYYFLNNNIKELSSFYRGSGIKHPSMNNVLHMEIPIPPLEVQAEIVRILDCFTELTSNLTTELTTRRQQYEYYRDSLLSKNLKYPEKTLGDICHFVRGPFGGSLKKESFKKNGFAIYEQQHAIYGYFTFRYFIDEDKFNQMKRFSVKSGDLIMSCSGTMGKVSIIPEDAPVGIINQALLKLTANENINNKYLKYCFENSITLQLNNNAQGGAIKNVASVDVLKKIKIPVPPLDEQERIVKILDRFDALCNDLSSGLPAEIKGRKQQYEYYRDKLLTFKEKS